MDGACTQGPARQRQAHVGQSYLAAFVKSRQHETHQHGIMSGKLSIKNVVEFRLGYVAWSPSPSERLEPDRKSLCFQSKSVAIDFPSTLLSFYLPKSLQVLCFSA